MVDMDTTKGMTRAEMHHTLDFALAWANCDKMLETCTTGPRSATRATIKLMMTRAQEARKKIYAEESWSKQNRSEWNWVPPKSSY